MRSIGVPRALTIALAALPASGVVGGEVGGKRVLQADVADGDEPWCAQLAAHGELMCGGGTVGAERCPQACAAAGGAPPPPPPPPASAICAQLAERGELSSCGSSTVVSEMCPAACSAAAAGAALTVETGFHTSCSILLELPRGCAHDLSTVDPSVLANTRVSDVCPMECSGRGSCAPTAIDLSFLGTEEDQSGHDNGVSVAGDACVDSGGVTFSGLGHIEIALDAQYATDATFSLAMWLLVAPDELWEPRLTDTLTRTCTHGKQTLFLHTATPHFGIEVFLSRRAWLDAWMLTVQLENTRVQFDLDASRGAAAKWVHIALVVDDANVQLFLDGHPIEGSATQLQAGSDTACVDLDSGPDWEEYKISAHTAGARFETCADLQGWECEGGFGALNRPWCPLKCGVCAPAGSTEYIYLGCFADALSMQETVIRDMNGAAGRSPRNPQNTIDPYGAIAMADPSPGECAQECAGFRYMGLNWENNCFCDNEYGSQGDAPEEMGTADENCGPYGSFCADGVEKVWGQPGICANANAVFSLDAWAASATSTAPGFRAAVSTLSETAFIGSTSSATMSETMFSKNPAQSGAFRGSIAMLQFYESALSAAEVDCVYDSGRQLVQNGRMAQSTESLCRGRVTTGCTSIVADNSPQALRIPVPSVDDGSCLFDELQGNPGEHGVLTITDSWQIVHLQGSYTAPVVLCSVITRQSTTQAVVRVRHVSRDRAGMFSFEIRAEQKSCHVATPPPSLEQASYMVLEAGVSAEGWQAATVRLHDTRWTRVSFMRPHHHQTVVVQQVQTFDNRTSLVSARNYLPPQANASQRFAFMLQLQGEGVWCEDGEFYAEYFDSLDLSGNPLATQCATQAPSENWHSTSGGVAPPLIGMARSLDPMLFSARWTTRLDVADTDLFVFSSTANQGSRIVVDGVTVLDYWEECCSTFSTEPVPLSVGYHTVAYEYRSGYTADYSPTNSYARLAWTVGSMSFGTDLSSNSSTSGTATALYADVAWLSVSLARRVLLGSRFEAGVVLGDPDLVTAVDFASASFDLPPHIFASVVAFGDTSAHLRLLETSEQLATLAIEFGTCETIFATAEQHVAWIALTPDVGESSVRVSQHQTLPTDTAALLAISTALRLPDYFHWRNSSDPCRDRWNGIECRTDTTGTPRIVVLDIHNVDLTNQDILWSAVGQLTALEEISMWNCGLSGAISPASLCMLTQLQVLALNRNQLRGTLPECMVALPLEWLYLSNNNFPGPLAELSPLGQYLKAVPSLSLERNRWAPLLASEKQALEDVSAPLGVETNEHEHNWDFAYSYHWAWASGSAQANRLMAEREVSYRQWSAGVQVAGFEVEVPFRLPVQGGTVAGVGIGKEGAFGTSENLALGLPNGDCYSSMHDGGAYHEYNCAVPPCYMGPRVCGAASQSSLAYGGEPGRAIDGNPAGRWGEHSCSHTMDAPAWFQLDLGHAAFVDRVDVWHRTDCCQDRLESANIVISSTPDFHAGEVCSQISDHTQEPEISLCGGRLEGRYVTVDISANGGGTSGGSIVALCEIAVFGLSAGGFTGADDRAAPQDTQDSTCWSSLSGLIPESHAISEQSTDRSSQGEAYFTDRFCPGWSSFISAAIPPSIPVINGAPQDESCRALHRLNGSPGLTFPAEGDEYGDSIQCQWTIQCASGRPRAHFTAFATEQGFDFVTVTGGTNAQQLSGNDDVVGTKFSSTTSVLTVEFASDGDSGNAGFSARLECQAVDLGNALFDGGNDMYDIGNLIVTNLMGDCANDPHDCALGSLQYRSDFELVPTNCFGADGHYQMQQSDAMWVFFTTNIHDSPIDFMIAGNLGSDGSGVVTEYVFDAAPHTGFVKSECGDMEGDPSVNHMIIVDSSRRRLTHSCDYAHGALGGGDCTGASSDLDDDIVSGIAPGSPILYLLYSTEGGSCMKEDDHRAIFDVATLCILAADPFSALNLRQNAGSQVLIEADVDDAGHILFGGEAPYAGWTRGNPRAVGGPSGFANALQFGDHDWLQLGDTGVDIDGNWTLDCWAQVSAVGLRSIGAVGVLLVSVDKQEHIAVHRQDQRAELGGKPAAGAWASSGVDITSQPQGWVRLTVSARRTVSLPETYSYFINGQLVGSLQLDVVLCGGILCPANVFAIGNRADGTAPLTLPLHRLRVFGGALAPDDLDSSGLLPPGDFVRYQPENSRSVVLSRGTDALDITWDTIGWNAAAHDHVHVALDSSGSIRLRCNNVSSLWDRAVDHARRLTGTRDVHNWTSSALPSDASVGLHIEYVDSDACFDLWDGVTCSLSDWPVGTDDCATKLDCSALGWPADARGTSAVCGSSSLAGTFGSGDTCVREASSDEAASLCAEMGGRLCTAMEFEQGEGGPDACGYDSIFKWSWVETPAEACPYWNQSLGMAGGRGLWFSFTPQASNVHEIQLRSQALLDGDTFAIAGVFDGTGQMISGQPATLHHNENGAMLRWNATQSNAAAYVHVGSTIDDPRYTMAVVVPPKYTWRGVLIQATQSFGAELALQKDGSVAVDLHFSFPFFGLEYRRCVWVSSFGMILFEQPSGIRPFGGVASVHNAIIAAAGEYDLNRAGARVTASQLSLTELKVAWHAPLFGSDSFSDVAVSLSADGSVTIAWESVDLSGGGSLGHGLVSWMQFEDDTDGLGDWSLVVITFQPHGEHPAEQTSPVVRTVQSSEEASAAVRPRGEFSRYTCNNTEETWPDKDHDLVCGTCTILADRFSRFSAYGGSCINYCAARGRDCVRQWEEAGDRCKISFASSCDEIIDSSDALCQCAPTAEEAEPETNVHGNALFISDTSYVQLPTLTIGGAVAVAAWVRLTATRWEANDIRSSPPGAADAGFTLFSTFQSESCGDSDACRNAAGETLNSGGWFAIGNDVANSRAGDLWGANTIYDQGTAGALWDSAENEWMMVTVSVSEKEASAFVAGELRGVGQMVSRLPRILRHNNYVGAARNAPYQHKVGGITIAIADLRLYDRSLSTGEVAALFNDPASECCISAGLKGAFGVADLDLTTQAMGNEGPTAVSIAPSVQGSSTAIDGRPETPGCVVADDGHSVRELDICGEITTVSDCSGVVSDGFGPYANSLDCGLQLQGFIGSTYTLTFDKFETEQDVDILEVYDGESTDAPRVAELSGTSMPAAITSTGRSLYLRFTSNDNAAAVGFRLAFSCAGTLVEYWKPADTAIVLGTGTISAPVSQNSMSTHCLSGNGVLMSVQCCADASMSCANARVTGVGLSGSGLRGSIPDALGNLGAMRSLKLHDNFLTGTLPSALSKLHLLRELQLSHNQFAMQGRESLSEILGGLMYLRTLEIGMSDEKEDLTKTIIQPTPPLTCHVGEPCALHLSTRTVDGLPLPHGGLQMSIAHAGDPSAPGCVCEDHMDGTYACLFPSAWTSHRAEFDFVISADGEEFVSLRTLVDPTTGEESTVETYGRLGVIVPPIECTQAHSLANADGSQCICQAGYYRNEYEGGWSCEHCVRGQEPIDEGTRCQSCGFGKFSAVGQRCDECPAGQEPNQDEGADDCERCGDTSTSMGKKCEPCPPEQVADSSRTRCICPQDRYNSTAFEKHLIQCIGKQHHGSLDKKLAPTMCSPCAGLECAECGVDGLIIKPGYSRSSTDEKVTPTPWFAFKCPGEKACVNGGQQRCREGHTGLLCNECLEGFGMVNDSCEACGEVNSSPVLMIAAMSSVTMGAGLAYYFCCIRKPTDGGDPSALQIQLTDNPLQPNSVLQEGRLSRSSTTVQRTEDAVMLARVVYQPARILVGYMQVITQIGLVLGFELPPKLKWIIKLLKPLAMSIKSFFQLDCLGAIDFYQEWTVRTLVIPFVLVVLVTLRYSFEIRRGEAKADAAGSLRANIFFIIFVLYPGICNEAFSMFNCRDLDGGLSIMETDYRVDCNSSQHTIYKLISGVVIVVFSLGIPISLVVLMLRRIEDYGSGTDSDRFVARRAADELKIDDIAAADAIRDISTGREYSFLVNSFKPRYYFWEGVDMIRKLILVGLLVMVGRGSVAQLFVAVVVSVALLVLQVTLQPYKHWEDNAFKAGVEVHISLTVTCALVLKCLGSQNEGEEVLPASFYDFMLVGSFIGSIPVGFVWTVCAKRAMMRESLEERAMAGDDDSSTRAKQRAIKLLHLGLTTNDDMRLLAAYFSQLENMVNKWSHVFISYRVASDRDLARRLYDALSAVTLDETGQKLRVYLDQTRLEDGQRWDSGFMQGLSQSWVFVPIVSVGSVQPMVQLNEGEDWCDNVLLEFTAALELHQRGKIKAVLPLLVGKENFFADAQDAFGGVSALPTHVSAATMEQVTTHLHDTTEDDSIDGLRELMQQASGQPEPTVQAVLNSLLKFQGIKVSQAGAGSAHSHGHLSVDMDDLSECVSRVHAAVSASLKRVGMGEASQEGQGSSPGRSSVLGRLSSRLAATVSSSASSGAGAMEWAEGGTEIQLGGGGDGSGGGLYLSSSGE